WSPPFGVSDPNILNTEITAGADTSIFYSLTASYPGCPDTSVGFRIDSWSIKVDLNEDTVVCKGAFVPLAASVQPHRSDYQYEWTPSAGVQPADAPNTYFLADSSMTYRLNVSTPFGCSAKDSIRIEVRPGDFADVIADTGSCPPSAISLWASGGVDYRWSPLYGLDDTTIANPLASPETPTTYTVYVTDMYGCRDTQKV